MPRFWSALSTLAGSASPWRAWRNEADSGFRFAGTAFILTP